MKTRLLLVVGTAMSLMSTAALAQNERQPSRPTDTTRSQPTQTDPNQTNQTRRDWDTTQRSGSVASVLHDLEGTWKVDIKVNSSLWHAKDSDWTNTQNRAPGTTDTSTTGANPSKTNTPGNTQNKNSGKGTTNPGSTDNDQIPGRSDINAPRDHSASPKTSGALDSAGLKSCTGYAVSDLIMGGNILRQTFASNDMGEMGGSGWDRTDSRNTDGRVPGATNQPASDKNNPRNDTTDRTDPNDSKTTPTDRSRATDPNRNDPSRNDTTRINPDRTDRTTDRATDRAMDRDDSLGAEAFRGMSFISFNPSNNTYDAVFMDSRRGEMMSHSGTYDATSKKIVFRANHAQSGMSGASGASGTTSRSDHMAYGDHYVVLEILGNNSHRVTMYKGSAPMASGLNSSTPSTTPSSTPSTTSSSPTSSSPTSTNSNSTTSSPNLADASNIIYTATFTRVSGSEKAGIDGMLYGDDKMWPSTTRNDSRVPRNMPPVNPR